MLLVRKIYGRTRLAVTIKEKSATYFRSHRNGGPSCRKRVKAHVQLLMRRLRTIRNLEDR
jgi:hypothetical protein